MSGEVRLWNTSYGDYTDKEPEPCGCDADPDHGPHHQDGTRIREYIALPAAEFSIMEAKARAYEWTLAALKSEHNRAMPFGQVMADLGLDQPPGEAVEIWVRYESGAVRALPSARKEGPK